MQRVCIPAELPYCTPLFLVGKVREIFSSLSSNSSLHPTREWVMKVMLHLEKLGKIDLVEKRIRSKKKMMRFFVISLVCHVGSTLFSLSFSQTFWGQDLGKVMHTDALLISLSLSQSLRWMFSSTYYYRLDLSLLPPPLLSLPPAWKINSNDRIHAWELRRRRRRRLVMPQSQTLAN